MTTPERKSTVINAALFLFGKSEFGTERNHFAIQDGGKADFEDIVDSVLIPETQQDVIEVVRRAVRRSRRP